MPGKEIDSKGMKGKIPAESGTRKDVKGEMDGRAGHLRYSHYEMGEHHTGKDFHDCHRGKGD